MSKFLWNTVAFPLSIQHLKGVSQPKWTGLYTPGIRNISFLVLWSIKLQGSQGNQKLPLRYFAVGCWIADSPCLPQVIPFSLSTFPVSYQELCVYSLPLLFHFYSFCLFGARVSHYSGWPQAPCMTLVLVWHWTPDSPATASQVLGPQASDTTSGLYGFEDQTQGLSHGRRVFSTHWVA